MKTPQTQMQSSLETELAQIYKHAAGIRGYLLDLEAKLIAEALKEHKTITDAAKALKTKRTTLSMRIIMHEERGVRFPKYGLTVKNIPKQKELDDGCYFKRRIKSYSLL